MASCQMDLLAITQMVFMQGSATRLLHTYQDTG